MKDKMNRRNFLKIGSLGATALSLEAQFGGLIPIFGTRGRNNSLFSKRLRNGIPSICDLCPAKCGIIGFQDYEWLAAIRGNPAHLNNRGRMCARGIAGINQVYSPDRILKPMMRTGKRGEGKWKDITWKEAYTVIADRLIEIDKTGRQDEFVFQSDDHHIRGLIRPFLDTFGNATLMPSTLYSDSNMAISHRYTLGEESYVPDAAKSHYFLNFGGNPFETHPQGILFNQRLVDARIRNHARLITLDPRLSNTAGKSDEWIPVNPGTDAIVALAMANVIVERGLHDAEFLGRWSNVGIGELRSHLSQYSPQRASEESGVEADVIERIAVEFAVHQPGIAFAGGGMTEHLNGVENERCVMLLNALVGNIDAEGGICLPRQYLLKDHSPLSTDDFEPSPIDFFERVNSGKKKVDSYFAYRSNPAYEYPDCKQNTSILKDESVMPFNVVMDVVMSETAALADIVLPASTCTESWDIDSVPSHDLIPFVSMARPVIKPCGESKSLNDVFYALSQRVGEKYQRSLNFLSMEGYYKDIATRVPGLTRGDGFNQLKKDGFWHNPDSRPEYNTYRNGGFNTASGKFEIAASRRARRSGMSALPSYVPIREQVTLAEDAFILVPYSVNVMPDDLANAKWLSEIRHGNRAMINPKTARHLKIKNGDTIEVKSDVGVLTVSAHVSQGVHPSVIAICKGVGHWEYGDVAQARKFDSTDPDTALLWWSEEKTGVNPKFLTAAISDPIGKGAAWMDTKVKIRKV